MWASRGDSSKIITFRKKNCEPEIHCFSWDVFNVYSPLIFLHVSVMISDFSVYLLVGSPDVVNLIRNMLFHVLVVSGFLFPSSAADNDRLTELKRISDSTSADDGEGNIRKITQHNGSFVFVCKYLWDCTRWVEHIIFVVVVAVDDDDDSNDNYYLMVARKFASILWSVRHVIQVLVVMLAAIVVAKHWWPQAFGITIEIL